MLGFAGDSLIHIWAPNLENGHVYFWVELSLLWDLNRSGLVFELNINIPITLHDEVTVSSVVKYNLAQEVHRCSIHRISFRGLRELSNI
jgi:hypothetical protein